MKSKLALPLIFIAALCACNQSTKTAEKSSGQTAKAAIPVNDTLNVYNNYLALKDELVKSNAAGAKAAAKNLQLALTTIKGCAETAKITGRIATSDKIKQQRADFLLLSSDLVALIKGTKVKQKAIYVDYCPMAGEKGGYWLSSTKPIANPYFGEDMKECGEVKEELK